VCEPGQSVNNVPGSNAQLCVNFCFGHTAALVCSTSPSLQCTSCASCAAQVSPELYPYGSRGPVGAHYLAAKYNVRWGDTGDDE
jgi:hypothetical protein